MKRKKSYDAIVLFERPLLMKGNIYGFLLYKQEMTEEQWTNLPNTKKFYDYICYLVGCSKWYQSGNSISEDTDYFIEGEKKYAINRWQVKLYCKNAYETNPLKFHVIKDGSMKFNKNDIEDSLIISKEKYDECMQILQ